MLAEQQVVWASKEQRQVLGVGVRGVRDELTFELNFGGGRMSNEGLEEGKGCSRQRVF